MKTSARAEVIKFVKRYVIGRVVVAAPITTQTDRLRVTAAYEEDAIYSNLVETASGFAFDLTTLARGTRYVAKKGGRELVAEGTLNAVRVIRYEVVERASTGRLIGHARFVASTNSEPDPFAGVVFLVRMALERGALKVYETMTGYADFPSANGGFAPGAVDGVYTYALERGKLTVRYEQERFDVDPITLARKRAGDKLPTQVSREIVFPIPNLATVGA